MKNDFIGEKTQKIKKDHQHSTIITGQHLPVTTITSQHSEKLLKHTTNNTQTSTLSFDLSIDAAKHIKETFVENCKLFIGKFGRKRANYKAVFLSMGE